MSIHSLPPYDSWERYGETADRLERLSCHKRGILKAANRESSISLLWLEEPMA